MERLEESIVEDGELEKRPEKETTKLAMKSNNCAQKNILTTTGINQTNSILVLDRTQSDVTTRERQIMKQVPSPSQLSVPNKPSEALAEDYTQGSALPVLEVPVKYDPKMLEVKVKRRIRLYAKISFCMAYIILSITFLIFFIAMLGWWISFSAYTMLNFERLIRMTSDWKMKSVLNGPLTSQRCGMLKISTLPWNSWTECIRSRVQSAQWRWRNLSAGLYFVDQQLINIKWC
uniref:Uncharacterized protein n=1 Tax=Setaria digitata TaxID=48799 RepID=A0A915Q3Z1_9BILA